MDLKFSPPTPSARGIYQPQQQATPSEHVQSNNSRFSRHCAFRNGIIVRSEDKLESTKCFYSFLLKKLNVKKLI